MVRRSRVLTIIGSVLWMVGCSVGDEHASSQGGHVSDPPDAGLDDTDNVVPSDTDVPVDDEDCIPRDEAPEMPSSASAYAELCSEYLGVVPTVDCGDGVPIPIMVNGEEVFESPNTCDHTDFKGNCFVGSRIGRLPGVTAEGETLPDVDWVYFCRSPGPQYFEYQIVSVQMIGHDRVTGATCFFEARDGAQWPYLELDENDLLDGELPGPQDPEFDEVFQTPPSPCVECHQTDPYIHNPWIDGARLPSDPSQPVLPEVLTTDSPYWVVAGADWDHRTVHIEGNGCVACHPAPMATAELFERSGPIDVDALMPPNAPGTMTADYEAMIACHLQGPDRVDGCEWVSPPTAYCDDPPLKSAPHAARYPGHRAAHPVSMPVVVREGDIDDEE